MTPIIDGVGLYPGGNEIPAAQLQIGLATAAKMQRLNAQGQPDPKNGKMVFVAGFGSMSNFRKEVGGFVKAYRATPGRGRDMTIFNAGLFNWDLSMLYAKWPEYEAWLLGRLASSRVNISRQQVQAIVMKNSKRGQDKPEQQTIEETAALYQFVFEKAKGLFPNLQQYYVTSANYSGYATKLLPRREPFAGWEGLGVKRFVENNLGSTPYVGWTWYAWADGAIPRSDGLRWLREHFASDGVHPSDLGVAVWGSHLLKFFETNPATAGWFKGVG